MGYHRTLLSFHTMQKLSAALGEEIQRSHDVNQVTREMLEQQVRVGMPHIPKRDAYALRVGKGRVETARDAGTGGSYKHLASQMLSGDTAYDGETESHRVTGKDVNQASRQEFGAGPNQRRRESAQTRVFPGGYAHTESVSAVKVAELRPSKLPNEQRAKVRALKANKDALAQYKGLILSDPIILDAPLDALPEVPYPPNDSDAVVQELLTIRDTMDFAPVPEDVMELADEEPLELFKRVCGQLQVPFDEEIVPLLVSDLRRYAMALKYVYGRPRPQEIAPYYEITIIPSDVDPYQGTPSYPSIHSTIGYGVANYYSVMYPQHADSFLDVADMIAMQRIQSGHHYPSDNAYAKLIADTLLSKEAPQAQTSAPEPVVFEPPAPPAAVPAAPQTQEKSAQWTPRRIKILP
jgi:hypothetical protein